MMGLECSLSRVIFTALDETSDTATQGGSTSVDVLADIIRFFSDPVHILVFSLSTFFLGYVFLYKLLDTSDGGRMMSVNYSIRRFFVMLVVLMFGVVIFSMVVWANVFGGIALPTDPLGDAIVILILGIFLGLSFGAYTFKRRW